MNKFLVIAEQGSIIKEIDEPHDDIALDVMQRAVGGWIELFLRMESKSRPGVTLDFYCNEEGRLNGMPLNVMVDAGDGQHVFDIMGPVLITAGDTNTGETLGLTDEEIKAVTIRPQLYARPFPVALPTVTYNG